MLADVTLVVKKRLEVVWPVASVSFLDCCAGYSRFDVFVSESEVIIEGVACNVSCDKLIPDTFCAKTRRVRNA